MRGSAAVAFTAALCLAGSAFADTAPQPTPEQSALISDLHWLIHQGHVIEFANGIMEMAKRPAPKPIRPEPAPRAESKKSATDLTGVAPVLAASVGLRCPSTSDHRCRQCPLDRLTPFLSRLAVIVGR